MKSGNQTKTVLSLAAAMASLILTAASANAASVIDLDRSTPFFFEQSKSISLGTILSIGILEVPPIPQRFDRVGLDLYYQKLGDVAVDPIGQSPARAGSLAGSTSTGQSRNFFSNSLIAPGDVVEVGNLASVPPYLNSVGGVAYDAETPNIGFGPFPDQELATFDFQFNEVGRVHFTWCGILDGVTGAPTSVPGNFYHDMTSSTPIPTSCGGEVFVDIFEDIVAVPEPSTFALAFMSLLGLSFSTWRRRTRS